MFFSRVHTLMQAGGHATQDSNWYGYAIADLLEVSGFYSHDKDTLDTYLLFTSHEI